jgi:hypothetical protein
MTKKIPLLTELYHLPEKNSVTTTLNDEVQEQFHFKQITFYPLRGHSLKGYKGNFNNLNKDYTISSVTTEINDFLSNTLEYKEKLMLIHNMVSK